MCLSVQNYSAPTHTHTKAGVGNKLAHKDADVAYLVHDNSMVVIATKAASYNVISGHVITSQRRERGINRDQSRVRHGPVGDI